MFKQRRYLIAGVAAAALFVFVGCGKKKSSGPSGPFDSISLEKQTFSIRGCGKVSIRVPKTWTKDSDGWELARKGEPGKEGKIRLECTYPDSATTKAALSQMQQKVDLTVQPEQKKAIKSWKVKGGAAASWIPFNDGKRHHAFTMMWMTVRLPGFKKAVVCKAQAGVWHKEQEPPNKLTAVANSGQRLLKKVCGSLAPAK